VSFFDDLGATPRRRDDPPHKHWLNPFPDNHGVEFCGHCADDWPCLGSRKDSCITCGEILIGLNRMYCDLDDPVRSYV
jgi:hypothetical protein